MKSLLRTFGAPARLTLTLALVVAPTLAQEVVTNPLGFKVTRISWSRKF